MASTCVVGLQWGDEAKGKIVDLLTEQHDFVVRFNGGANAGHTVVYAGQTFKLSLLPTGVLRPSVRSVIANGVVVYPPRFLEEVGTLRAAGVLAPSFRTLAYTYLGSELTWPIYWNGTLGRAKADLDRTAAEIRAELGEDAARVVALKAVVTQASSAIPVVPPSSNGRRPVRSRSRIATIVMSTLTAPLTTLASSAAALPRPADDSSVVA